MSTPHVSTVVSLMLKIVLPWKQTPERRGSEDVLVPPKAFSKADVEQLEVEQRQRRNSLLSLQPRRGSLVEAIPDLPKLRKRKIAPKVHPFTQQASPFDTPRSQWDRHRTYIPLPTLVRSKGKCFHPLPHSSAHRWYIPPLNNTDSKLLKNRSPCFSKAWSSFPIYSDWLSNERSGAGSLLLRCTLSNHWRYDILLACSSPSVRKAC